MSLLSDFPIPPHVRFKLNNAGYTVIEDLKDMKPLDVMKETDLSHEEILDLVDLVFPQGNTCGSSVAISALDLLQKEQSQTPIITFCQKLDEILDGGIPLTKLTEICGTPGTGKTQLCLQLCVDVHIPTILGGIKGEAIYIDSEGSFLVERLVDIAVATNDHCKYISSQKEQSKEMKDIMKAFTVESILQGIHYFSCHDYIELLAVVNLLPEFLKNHQKVKLVVIDSIAFHFRYGFDGNYGLRTRLLNGISQSLIQMAVENNLAVVLTNQMITKINEDKTTRLVPALGESWGHACTVRINLFWKDDQRHAMLFKSPWKQEAIVPYQITKAGIRDAVLPDQKATTNKTNLELHPSKRPRT